MVPLLTKSSHIICLTPSPLQEEQCAAKWKNYVQKVSVVAASPYGDWGELEKAAEEISGMEGDLIVLDCIGYTQEMKKMFAQKPVRRLFCKNTSGPCSF